MTLEVIDTPRCCSRAIQSEVAFLVPALPLTSPASRMAPPNHKIFSVIVVLPASGWEIIAKVLLRLNSTSRFNMGFELSFRFYFSLKYVRYKAQMAKKENKYIDNIPGRFYVDKECIACDACILAAPDHFAMNEDDGHA